MGRTQEHCAAMVRHEAPATVVSKLVLMAGRKIHGTL